VHILKLRNNNMLVMIDAPTDSIVYCTRSPLNWRWTL